jgi:hippurate hydrolase
MTASRSVPTDPSSLLARIRELAPQMSAVRHDLHRHPELAYGEQRTAAVIAKLLREWGIEVHEGIGKTGLVGVIAGSGGGDKAIGLRADMDALPIQETSGAPHASIHAGVAHSCGHDGHMAMLLCAARYLVETRRFDGRVHLLFQPAEEGLAGAQAMIEDGLFKRFPCAEVYGLHNWPTLPAGTIATRAGPIMGASDRFTITIRGAGGHAAMPHLTTDTVLCAAQIVTGAHTLVARRIDPMANAVLSITRIQGGASHNVLPGEVQLFGTVRTFDSAVQDKLEATLREWAELTAKAAGCSASVDYARIYPATVNDPACAQHALDAAVALFGRAVRAESPAATAEDFAFMLQQVPGAYIWVGSRNGESSPSLHHPSFDFNDEALPAGAALLASLAERRLAAG